MASKGFNKVMALGTLTKDPELRRSASGKAYLFFDLACNYSVRDSDGSYKDAVDFLSFTAFEKLAETVAKYCVKGSQLLVEGKVRKTKRQDKDGSTIYETQLAVQNIYFAGGKRRDEASSGSSCEPFPFDEIPAAPAGDANIPF